jgi:hypothetical protein
MDLLPVFEWLEATTIGELVRGSTWVFPVIESFHLLALAVLGGVILLVNFRLLGLGLRQPVAELAAGTHQWLVYSVMVAIASGVPLFLSEATKCYYSGPFWIKMEALALALIFTFTVWRTVTRADDTRYSALSRATVGVVSIVLWATVAWGGRWIGFAG